MTKWKRLELIAASLCFVVMLDAVIPARAFAAAAPRAESQDTVRIAWDTWGVPHITATSQEGLFWGFGWAQMHNHPTVLLKLYGKARGRAAEYWGKEYLRSDLLAATLSFSDNAKAWYRAQPESFRRNLDAFASGINAYAAAHAREIPADQRVVLPVTATDLFARFETLSWEFLTVGNRCGVAADLVGSNAWAIGPRASANAHAMLLGNPHIGWDDDEKFTEAHLIAPGVDAYGIAWIGLPVFLIGFNDNLGWTVTTNVVHACTLYQLTADGDGYLLDRVHQPFGTRTVQLTVRNADGTASVQQLQLRRSVQGPVVGPPGKSFAIRVTGVDQFASQGALREFWNISTASNLAEFKVALSELQIPLFNFLYADRLGHIFYKFTGEVPVKPMGDVAYWDNIVPGDSSVNIWTRIYGYSDLPEIQDPPSDWLQNSNSPPWLATIPPVLDPARYGSMIDRFFGLREARSIQMLTAGVPISYDGMMRDAFSTRSHLADLILDDLIASARQTQEPSLLEAADVLQKWDRQFEPQSRGAVLFAYWFSRNHFRYWDDPSVFKVPWSPEAPLTTPNGFARPADAVNDLRDAASAVRSQFGHLAVAYEDAFRIRYGKYDLPGSGGMDLEGVFAVMNYEKGSDGLNEATGGTTYMMAVEFSRPIRASGLLVYGNSSDPKSPHYGDQLPLWSRRAFRPIWFSRDDVDAHLESRDILHPYLPVDTKRSRLPR